MLPSVEHTKIIPVSFVGGAGTQLRHGHQGCTSPSFVGSAIPAPAECPDSVPLPCAALHSLTCFFGFPAPLPSVKMGQTKGGKRASCIREGESTWSSPEFGRGLGCILPKISIGCSWPEAAVAPFLPTIRSCSTALSPTSRAADRIKEKSSVWVMGRGKTEADRPPTRKW